MFIDADGNGKTYVELQVTPKGTMFDSYLPAYRQNQNDWTSGMKVGGQGRRHAQQAQRRRQGLGGRDGDSARAAQVARRRKRRRAAEARRRSGASTCSAWTCRRAARSRAGAGRRRWWATSTRSTSSASSSSATTRATRPGVTIEEPKAVAVRLRRRGRRRARRAPRCAAELPSRPSKKTSSLGTALRSPLLTRPRWNTVDELGPVQRVLASLIDLLITTGARAVGVRLVSARARCSRHAGPRTSRRGRRARCSAAWRARRPVGVYLAVEVAPLPARLDDRALGGARSCSARWWPRGVGVNLVSLVVRHLGDARQRAASASASSASTCRSSARSPRWRRR